MKFLSYIKEIRPNQWTKNILIFAGIAFSGDFFNILLLAKTISAFFIFSFLSGVVYILNDIADVEIDKKHPQKCNRPIAKGDIKIPSAIIYASLLLVISLVSAYLLDLYFFLISLLYLILNILYSFILKHTVLLDVMLVAFGFVLRAIAGTTIIHGHISGWFLLCTFSIALLLAASKRRYELLEFEEERDKQRKVLEHYNELLFNQLISIAAACSIIFYSLYTIQGRKDTSSPHNEYLFVTIPFVVYAIFRYLYIVYKKQEGGNPEKIFYKDKHILITVFLFGLTIIFLLNKLPF